MLYSHRKDNKQAFTQIFKIFTDAVGGDPAQLADLLYGRFTVEDFRYADDLNYHTVFEYFKATVIPHKIEVYNAGLKMISDFETPWLDAGEFMYMLWVHDLSKFSANEAFGYAAHNFASTQQDITFDLAWAHHKNHNDHHPEHFLNPNKQGVIAPLPMDRYQTAEMVCDWIGAGKTYGNTLENWLPQNLHKFVWHENTAANVSLLLDILGFDTKREGTKLTMI